jgi:hypothetical protein
MKRGRKMTSPLTAKEQQTDIDIARAQEEAKLPDWTSGRYSIAALEADRYYGGEDK